MVGLTPLEQAALDKLLAGDHPLLAALRRQASDARLVTRELTGVGFYCRFQVPPDSPRVERDVVIADVYAEIEGLAHGAGFALFVRDGRIQFLEGFTYDEPWPERIGAFELAYSDPERTGLREP